MSTDLELLDQVMETLDVCGRKLARIRLLHVMVDRGYGPECSACGNHVSGIVSWPCKTIRIVDGEGEESTKEDK